MMMMAKNRSKMIGNLKKTLFSHLFHFFVLQKDRGFAEGEARKVFNAILASLGKGDPLAIEFQRKLFTLLY